VNDWGGAVKEAFTITSYSLIPLGSDAALQVRVTGTRAPGMQPKVCLSAGDNSSGGYGPCVSGVIVIISGTVILAQKTLLLAPNPNDLPSGASSMKSL
jgi:hypothetical protein